MDDRDIRTAGTEVQTSKGQKILGVNQNDLVMIDPEKLVETTEAFSNLNDNLSVLPYNLIDLTNVVNNMKFDTSDAAWSTTDYIFVKGQKSLSVCGKSFLADNSIEFYDESKNKISKVTETWENITDFPIPDNAFYCRITIRKYSDANDLSTVMLCYGNVEPNTQYRAFNGNPLFKVSNDVDSLKNDLEDHKMNNLSTNDLVNGHWTDSFVIDASQMHLSLATKFSCNAGDIIELKTNKPFKQIYVRYNNGISDEYYNENNPTNKFTAIVPSGVTSFGVTVSNRTNISVSDGVSISVKVGDEITKLNSNLYSLNNNGVITGFEYVYDSQGAWLYVHLKDGHIMKFKNTEFE